MAYLKILRAGFIVCLLMSSMLLILIKLLYKSNTMKISDRTAIEGTWQDHNDKVMRNEITFVNTVSSVVLDGKNTELPTNSSRQTAAVKAAASPTKTISAVTTFKPISTSTKHTEEKSQHTPAATPAEAKPVPIITNSPYEQRFLKNVELFLQKLPPNSTYGKAATKVIDIAKSRVPGWESNDRENLHDSQFINYMKCPTSVRKKMLTNPHVRGKFIPEVPILAWNKHYTNEEYNRLKEFHMIFGWKHTNQTHVAESLTAINRPQNRYMFDDRLVNGSIPNDGKCIQCAVVGNGGILNGSKKGKEIDANDYVFRVNTALTKSHEDDVGSRTSFYCFGIITLSNTIGNSWRVKFQVPNDKGIRYVFFADSYWAYSYLAAVLNGKEGIRLRNRPPLRFPKKLHAEDIKLVHPDFERYIKWSWVRSPRQFRSIYRPTTGGIMLLLALHTCDEVNAYGFGGSFNKFSDHYYDKTFQRRMSIANHDSRAENKLWKQLHEDGIINLYTRE